MYHVEYTQIIPFFVKTFHIFPGFFFFNLSHCILVVQHFYIQFATICNSVLWAAPFLTPSLLVYNSLQCFMALKICYKKPLRHEKRYIGIFRKSLRLWVAIFNIYENVFIWILQQQFDICMNCIMELVSCYDQCASVQKKKDFLFLESTNFYALCFSAKMNEVKKGYYLTKYRESWYFTNINHICNDIL